MYLEGIISFPTAMVNKDDNTLKCTPCGGDICPSDTSELGWGHGIWPRDDVNNTEKLLEQLQRVNSIQDVINDEWVDAYCLVTELGLQIQYFPYFILMLSLIHI